MKNTEKYLKKERTKSFNAVFNRFLGKPKLSAEIALVKREAAISGDENILKDCKEKKPVPKFINLLTASTLKTFNFPKQDANPKNSNLLTGDLVKYTEVHSLKDADNTHAEIRKAFRELQNITAKNQTFAVHLCGSTNSIRNGKFFFRINPDFAKLYKHFSPEPINQLLYCIDCQKFPNAYFLDRELRDRYLMNNGRANQHKISVRALVKANPNMPDCDDIKKRSRDN